MDLFASFVVGIPFAADFRDYCFFGEPLGHLVRFGLLLLKFVFRWVY